MSTFEELSAPIEFKDLPAPSKGMKCGSWTLIDEISRGGHGHVWKANGSTPNNVIAIKLLTKIKEISYKRFKAEVHVMRNYGVLGIVPILDAHLPEDPRTSRPWYVMPLGVGFLKHLGSAPLRQKVESVARIADTMAALHAKQVAHRDIKPANMLFVDGLPCIADFGLVDYPGKEDLTAKREELGPRWTMAPEVRRHARDVDARPADVYSLAKSLWILITGVEQGFEGQYARRSTIAISEHEKGAYTSPLEDLLAAATEHMPERRPTMAEFAKGLYEWIKVDDEFHERNRLEWIEALNTLFPVTIPERVTWTRLDDILNVLNFLGTRSNMNHMLFPTGGGSDLQRATKSLRENGCIELVADGLVNILKPEKLSFESFGEDAEWNYFRLETADLSPSGAYPNVEKYGYEELTDVGGRIYASLVCWNNDNYRGEELPPNSRHVTRYFRGAFVIVQKMSTYNSVPETYDGLHAQMSAEEFRQYIQRNATYKRR